jgi:alkylated DNA repair dioxygenase AlkB
MKKPEPLARAFSFMQSPSHSKMLFQIDPFLPPGFSYFGDFRTAAEEEQLLSEISAIELHAFNFHGYEAKRRVVSYGYHYNFENKSLSRAEEIPPGFHNLRLKVAEMAGLTREHFVQLLVTEYPAGSVINWHRDAPPFDLIAGVSLLADCTFRLRPQESTRRTRGSVISLNVERRSLYIIRGEARTSWQHSISPVSETRYSITLRSLRQDR